MSRRKSHRITYQDRLKLEALYNAKVHKKKIAEELGIDLSNVYREIKRGLYQHLNSDLTYTEKYSAVRAQQIYDHNAAGRYKDLKVGKDYAFVAFVENLILNHKYSPRAVLAEIRRRKLHFDTDVSYNTIYRYIDNGIFPHLKRTDLPYKPRKKKKKKIVEKKQNRYGTSIEQRPEEVLSRDIFGHWEFDSVIGKREKGNTMLVLTERSTRYEMILRSDDKSVSSTVKVIDTLEKKFGKNFRKLFKSITCDNGVEFSAPDLLERSIYGNGKCNRTAFYYCHPFCSSERGSNEKQNQMIRRWISKGEKIENFSDQYIQDVADWLNDYPRGIFDYQTSRELFEKELKKLGLKIFA